jgi:hypothetical protein
MAERVWQTSLAVEVIDPVTGLLVCRGVTVSAVYARGGEAVRSPAETISGRFAFRGIEAGQPIVLRVTPRDVPFFPVSQELTPSAGNRLSRIVLVPRRDYPFSPADLVIHQRLIAAEGPVASASVALEETPGLLGAPARTDADGEFVLFLRSNGTRRPQVETSPSGPMPPGLEHEPIRQTATERRIGLLFTRDAQVRRLPSEEGLILPRRGRLLPSGPDDVIRWENLLPVDQGSTPTAAVAVSNASRMRRARSDAEPQRPNRTAAPKRGAP